MFSIESRIICQPLVYPFYSTLNASPMEIYGHTGTTKTLPDLMYHRGSLLQVDMLATRKQP